MKIIKNFLYNASYQVFILLVPLLTTPYLARVFGPTGVGINSYTNSIMQYFVLFGCLGTNIYANRKIAFVRDDEEELTKTFWELFILRMLMLSVSFILFMAFIYIFGKNMSSYYIAQSITILGTILDVSWFFMGIERFSVIVVKNFAVKIFTLICVFTLVKTQNDLVIYIAILSISLFLGNLSMIPNLKKEIHSPIRLKLNIYQHFLPSLMLFVPEVATQVYVMLNKTMLGVLVSFQASGYYDQSDKVVKIVLAVVTASGTVMLPHVANAFANRKYDKTKELLYDSFSLVTAISVPMFFGLASITSKLVPLFFSTKFNMVVPLMQVESVVILLIAWSNAIGVQYLLPTKQNKKYTTSIILGALFNILLNIPLILMFDSIGAIVSTVISEMIVSGYQFYSIRKQISIPKMFSGTYKYFISGFLMFIFVSIINDELPFTWIYLFLEIFFGILVYLILIVLLRANVFMIIRNLKNQ
ncbi:flippase [Apilactobacillus kunkeei]|nr:flippase [Apilactobacillus kunkeei]TMT04243.1 flippase [Apilactobacillus kunkeei]